MILDVPDTIPLSKVQAFCADLGFQIDDLIEIRVGIHGVHAELWARDENGKRFRAPDGKSVATHTVAIPLDREA